MRIFLFIVFSGLLFSERIASAGGEDWPGLGESLRLALRTLEEVNDPLRFEHSCFDPLPNAPSFDSFRPTGLSHQAVFVSESVCRDSDPTLWIPLQRALLETVVDSLKRSEPYLNETNPRGSRVRTGYDYHSHMHARWARLSLSRHLGDETARSIAKAEYPLAEILREAELSLRSNPLSGYSMAWMLLLLEEYSIGETARVRERIQRAKARIFLELEKDLRRTLDESPVGSGFSSGWHDDPSVILTIALRAKPSPPQRRGLMDLAQIAMQEIQSPQSDAFFSPLAFRALVGGQRSPAPTRGSAVSRINRRVRESLQRSGEEFRVSITETNLSIAGHAITFELTEGWPDARRAEGCKDWVRRANGIFSRPDFWRTSFLTSHYVPQFLWFGFLLQKGEL